MSLLSAIQAAFIRTEQAVEAIAINIVKGEQVAISDIQGAANWLTHNAPAIAGYVTQAATIAEAVGATSNPEFAATVAAANIAVQGLNAFAAAHNAGQSTAASVVQGYVAYQQATGAVSQAKAAAIIAKSATVIGIVNSVAPSAITAPAAS